MAKKTKTETSDEKGKKGFESTYQADKLRKCITSGMSALDIMAELDIKSKQVLKQHCLKLIQEDKVFYEIPGLYARGTRTVTATPKGEIKIGPSVLKAQGAVVHPRDQFHLSVDGDNIILSKIDKEDAAVAKAEDSLFVDDVQGQDNDSNDSLLESDA